MPTFTAQQIIDRAKAAADMTDDFVSNQQWFDWLNVERLKLETMMLRHGYVIRESTIDTPGADYGTGIAITDPLAILAIWEIQSDGNYRFIRNSNSLHGPAGRRYGDTGPATSWRAYQYAALPNITAIELHPVPSTGDYRTFYVPSPTNVTAVSDTLSYPAGWEDYIVLGMAARALAKEETQNPMIERERQRIEQHIETSAWDRAFASGSARVRNVDRFERDRFTYPQIPTREHWYVI